MRDKEWVNPVQRISGMISKRVAFLESLDKNCLSIFYGTHAVALSSENKRLKKGKSDRDRFFIHPLIS